MVEIGDPQTLTPEARAWHTGREWVASLGRIPPVFSLAVRSLMSDHYRGDQNLSPASFFLVNRLMRSPTMKAIEYYSALTFHADSIANCAYLSTPDLIRLYKPADLASIIGVSYYFRMIRRVQTLDTTSAGWFALSRRLIEQVDLGGHAGYAIPAIGAGRALLAGALLPLAHSLFYINDASGSESYLKGVYVGNHPLNFEFETKRWGCTCLDVISNLLQFMGFGMPWMDGIITALTSPKIAETSQGEPLHFFYALYWIDILRRTGQAPSEKIPAVYYPAQKELYRLLFWIAELREKGSRHQWLEKGRSDISPSLTPQLYQEYLAEAAGPEEVKQFCTDNISEELLEGLSEQDFALLVSKDTNPIDI